MHVLKNLNQIEESSYNTEEDKISEDNIRSEVKKKYVNLLALVCYLRLIYPSFQVIIRNIQIL